MVNLHYTNIYANYFKCLGSKELLTFGGIEPDEQPVVLSGEIAGADVKQKNTPKALLRPCCPEEMSLPFPLIGCSENYMLS